jgi:DNA-binding NtrC family response regulator
LQPIRLVHSVFATLPARELDPTLSVVFLTAFATVELAVESMRQGAFDFITKPFQPEVLRATARRACEHTDLLRENDLLKLTVDRLEGSAEIFGSSLAILACTGNDREGRPDQCNCADHR